MVPRLALTNALREELHAKLVRAVVKARFNRDTCGGSRVQAEAVGRSLSAKGSTQRAARGNDAHSEITRPGTCQELPEVSGNNDIQ